MAFTTYLCAKPTAAPQAITDLPGPRLHHGPMAYKHRTTSVRRETSRADSRRHRATPSPPVCGASILQDEYGVELDKVTWAPSGDEHVAEYAR